MKRIFVTMRGNKVMRKVSFIAVLMGLFVVNNASAGAKADGAAFVNKWGVGGVSDYACKSVGTDYGMSGDKSVTKTNTKWHAYLNKNFVTGGYGKAQVFYIATEMQEKGYKFCKYYLGADRTNCTHTSWTGYWEYKEPECFWLCEPGYYGSECGDKELAVATHDFAKDKARLDTITGKDHHHFAHNDFTGKGNTEANIPMFHANYYAVCNSGSQNAMQKMNKAQEHDVILTAKKLEIDETKKTVKYTIQPMVVRAASVQGCLGADGKAWAFTQYVANARTDLCPEDMMYLNGVCVEMNKNTQVSNEEKTQLAAAVAKAETLEEQGLALLCNGWPKDKYDNKIHALNSDEFKYTNWRTSTNVETYCKGKTGAAFDTCKSDYDSVYGDASATCTVFVCKDGKGYKGNPSVTGDFTCVDCNTVTDTTIHPSRLGLATTGECLTCKLGEVFSEGTCVPAKQIHKFYMAGDVKEDARSIKLDTQDQCWTKPTPDEYRRCMKQIGWAKMTSEEPLEGVEEETKKNIDVVIEKLPGIDKQRIMDTLSSMKIQNPSISDAALVKEAEALVSFSIK